MFWKNKVVIITGSGNGIGLATAFEAGSKGARIVLNCRNSARLENALAAVRNKGITALAVRGDITNYSFCKQLIEESISAFGRIDLLVNNAALNAIASFEDLDPGVFKKVIDVNLIGSVNMTKAALPHIKNTRGGILFVGSLLGVHGMGNYSAYASSKMALRALVESLRVELDDTGVYFGLAYVACTENSKDKQFLDASGECIPEPPRRRASAQKTESVARILLRMARVRQVYRYFSPLGKLNVFINHFLPGLIHLVFRKTYLQDRKLQAAISG